uniref:Multidrug and toxin extrusion protein n=2 Tax=Trichobilharzia regenti TaxID=157069 RepID=A0AA85JG05_TRIRE|nr:unnamed protein product [Trichobilharzia regenti]
MSLTYSGSQSEGCALLKNDYLNQNCYDTYRQSINIKRRDDGDGDDNESTSVNEQSSNHQGLENKGIHLNLKSGYVPMESTSNETIDNTIQTNETTTYCEEIEVPEIVNTGFLGKYFPFGFCYEFKKLVRLALPITITSVIAFLSGPVSLIFCGRLGKTALATVGLANSVFNVAGLAVVTGLLTAADTLFAQTFGSPNKSLMGVHLQRALVIMTIMCMPCWSFYLCIEPILLAMKQNPLIARKTSDYLLFMMPGLYFAAIGQVLTKYVQSQNRVYIPMVIGIMTNLFNALMHYVLLFVFQIGVRGSAISQSFAYLFQCLCFLPYIIMLERSGVTWKGWSSELWLDWGKWFKLAMPGVVMITLEWSIFEIGSIISGTLGERELATQTILFNIESICYTLLPLGFGIATSIRLGQFLGARSAAGPRSVISTALVVLWTTSIAFILVLVLLRWEIPKIFTSEPDVIELTASLMPLIAAFQIFDGTVGVCSGAIRGAGLQLFGAIVCFVTLYLIGSPIGLSLVFAAGYGLEGLWAGMTVGTILEGIVYLITCQRINWQKQVELAIQRTNQLMSDNHLSEERINHGNTENSNPSYKTSISVKDEHVEETEEIDGNTSASLFENSNDVGIIPDLPVDRSVQSHTTLRYSSQQLLVIRLRAVILYRILFTLIMLCLLSFSVILRLYKPWSGKFGAYCTFPNGSFISLKNQNNILSNNINKLLLDGDTILLNDFNETCFISVP